MRAPKVRRRSITEPAVVMAALHPLSSAAAMSPITVTRRRSSSCACCEASRSGTLWTSSPFPARPSAVRTTSAVSEVAATAMIACVVSMPAGNTAGSISTGIVEPSVSARIS